MTITIQIPDAVAQRVLNGFAASQNYQPEINGQPNPETKGQFAKRKLIEYIRAQVTYAEMNDAKLEAEANARAKVENEVTLS